MKETEMNHNELALHYLGMPGEMITGSKSSYYARNPGHRVYFNANLAIDGRFVWHGDLDLDEQKTVERLRAIAREANVPVHVLPENPYRFKVPTRDEILSDNLRSVVRIDP